jgi:hypothetical protein
MSSRRDWVLDLLVGAMGGGVVGAIAALNLIIFTGMSEGYETPLPQVFRENFVVGLAVVVLLVAGPVIGVWLMRRRRHRANGRV